MIRWFVGLWRGPLCDAGTAVGRGCLKAGIFETLPHPPGWKRGFRWCEEHESDAGRAIGLEEKQGGKP